MIEYKDIIQINMKHSNQLTYEEFLTLTTPGGYLELTSQDKSNIDYHYLTYLELYKKTEYGIDLAVVGLRKFQNKEYVFQILDNYSNRFEINKIISGGADGVDTFAKEYAQSHEISFQVFKAEWKLYGRAAGPIRNKKIIENCDYVLAFWNGTSTGTKSSINLAKKYKKDYEIIYV